ncbi:MAG: TetR/AcrR family transcriptional regulator [Pseudomonadota bacterium]|nr:TetR/AcrR family transcriptional regulator [Pseudomonadota bacterium]
MSDLPRKRGKQSAEAAAQTRDTIIQAAIECFAQNGYEAASVREIAHLAQCTHGTLRHHFGSKLDIWKAVADTVLEHYRARLMPIASGISKAQNPLDSFRQVVRGFIEASYHDPMLAKLLMVENHGNNERADYVKANFLSLHEPIGLLFEQARAQSPQLSRYNNDTFFLTLLSLTFFPLILPGVTDLLSEAALGTADDSVERIMGVLFGTEPDRSL